MLSIMRSVNSSPHQLVWPSIRQPMGKTPLALTGLLLVALCTSIVSQFTSTILLLDFGDRSLQDKPSSSNVRFGLSDRGIPKSLADFVHFNSWNSSQDAAGAIDPYSGVNYSMSSFPSYPSFAEWHQPASPEDGVSDTGVTYRAFLPFGSSERRRGLRKFTGVTTVLDFRTVCVRPKISLKGDLFLDSGLIALNGFAEWDREYSMLSHLPYPPSGYHTKTIFNCSVALDEFRIQTMGYWRTTLCRTMGDVTLLKGSQGGLVIAEGNRTESYILFNVTGSVKRWSDAGNITQWKVNPNGPWTTHSAYMANHSLFISTTLCFINPSPSDYDVDIWGTIGEAEPSLSWNDTAREYNTESTLRLYGALDPKPTFAERGILNLNNHAN